VFHAFEADLAEVLTAARTLPFLGSRRVVVLRDIEKLRQGEGRSALLEDYLKAPTPETVFVSRPRTRRRRRARERHGSSGPSSRSTR